MCQVADPIRRATQRQNMLLIFWTIGITRSTAQDLVPSWALYCPDDTALCFAAHNSAGWPHQRGLSTEGVQSFRRQLTMSCKTQMFLWPALRAQRLAALSQTRTRLSMLTLLSSPGSSRQLTLSFSSMANYRGFSRQQLTYGALWSGRRLSTCTHTLVSSRVLPGPCILHEDRLLSIFYFYLSADKSHTCERSRNPTGSLSGADRSTDADALFWNAEDVYRQVKQLMTSSF